MPLTPETWKAIVDRKFAKSPAFHDLDVAVRAYLSGQQSRKQVALLAVKWRAWLQRLNATRRTYKQSDRYVNNGALEALENLCQPRAESVNVYLSGHGFMWTHIGSVPNNLTLKFKMWTYVFEDHLFDGRALKGLIDDGKFSAEGLTYLGHAYKADLHPAGEQTVEYLLCSDHNTARDYEESRKYKAVGQTDHPVNFKSNLGSLIELDDQNYVFVTSEKLLTRLSDIQEQLNIHFWISDAANNRESEIALHWAACRSFVNAATHEAMIAMTNRGNVRVDGLAGAQLEHEVVDSIGGVPVTGIEEAIKSNFASQVCDCIIHAKSDSEVITIILPMPGMRNDSLFESAAEFSSRARSGISGGLDGAAAYKFASNKGLLVLPAAIAKDQKLVRRDAIAAANANRREEILWSRVKVPTPAKKVAR